MSAQDRYTKIIESLVNGEEAKASDLLHEAFVEKAREIWTDLVEQDELAEEEVEELEEGIEEEDFLNDIEDSEDEIKAEEAFGEAEEDTEDMLEPEAEMELADDEMDFDADGELDAHEEEHSDIEDKLVSVEDALADLKAEFAQLMGASDDEEEMEDDFEDEESEESEEDEVEEEFAFEELEESAELTKVGKDGKIHPVDMPAGDDGKASPVKDAGNDMAEPVSTDTTKETGGTVKAPAQMTGFKHPGEGADLTAAPKAK
jgi:hypothetical protein